ncbi:hypothetical protein FEE95_11025 [Maribacter algarum]|uniref:Uncharacterized protein n=1 Tax=Maribacter algarum (ex Zhang et al. 2020) TaxID=2578118 RepID=A0A5S3PQJ4_9FLAO|nr:hypothetical protein [Maribacter algarum]TMM57017.1 hypothetical protein FEE95_11025 [Maribacter algarum]
MLETHIKIAGFSLMALALVHIIFPKYFSWKSELKNLSLINRQMMQVHTFFIALIVFLVGLLCTSSNTDLVHTPLGKRISLGLSFFWGIRMGIQFFGYSPKLWKGKVFETIVHIVFSLLWIYLATVFFLAYSS